MLLCSLRDSYFLSKLNQNVRYASDLVIEVVINKWITFKY